MMASRDLKWYRSKSTENAPKDLTLRDITDVVVTPMWPTCTKVFVSAPPLHRPQNNDIPPSMEERSSNSDARL